MQQRRRQQPPTPPTPPTSPPPATPPPALAIYWPADDLPVTPADTTSDEPSSAWTVPRLIEHLIAYDLASNAPAYHANLRIAGRIWQQCHGPLPLAGINQTHTAIFYEWLVVRQWRGRTIGPRTVARICREVQAALNKAAPRSRTNQDGLVDGGLFGLDQYGRPRESPWIKRPKLAQGEVKPRFTDRQFAWMHSACAIMEDPAWWRALFLWSWNVGTRRSMTLSLRWAWFRNGAKRGSYVLRVPAAHSKTARQTGRQFESVPVNRHGYQAAASIRGADGRLFPWDQSLSHFHVCMRKILAEARRLCEEAGEEWGEEPRSQLHGLRRSCATETALRAIREAQQQMGHTKSKTTSAHYVDPLTLAAEEAGDISQPMLFD